KRPTTPPTSFSADRESTMTIAFYEHPFSSYVQKAKTALYEKGIPFESKMIDGSEPVASEFAARTLADPALPRACRQRSIRVRSDGHHRIPRSALSRDGAPDPSGPDARGRGADVGPLL